VCGVLDPSSCPQATDFCEARMWGDLLTGRGSLLGRRNPYNIKVRRQQLPTGWECVCLCGW
jgi:hypothetical protein